MTGRFITLDGPDGTGKSTQCRLLAETLRAKGVPTTAAIDPGGTPLGAKLRELLLYGREHSLDSRAEALLFMASRVELVRQVIQPALARGAAVVSDRYTLANVVYQGHAGGLDAAELRRLVAYSACGVSPDLTIVLDVPPEVARLRRKPEADRVESRGADYQARVRAGFLSEAAADPVRVKLIDATPDIEAVRAAVWAAVVPLFPGLA